MASLSAYIRRSRRQPEKCAECNAFPTKEAGTAPHCKCTDKLWGYEGGIRVDAGLEALLKRKGANLSPYIVEYHFPNNNLVTVFADGTWDLNLFSDLESPKICDLKEYLESLHDYPTYADRYGEAAI